MKKFQVMAAAVGVLLASPTMAANTGALLGVNIAAITSAGGSNNDDVGLTVAYLNSPAGGFSNVVYLGTLSGPGNNPTAPPAGESITGSITGTTATFNSSLYLIVAYDVKASNSNALYKVVPGVLSGVLDSTAITNGGGNIPAISHADFFGVKVGPVPEPATWAMMLLGFGGIGLSVRRGRKQTANFGQIA